MKLKTKLLSPKKLRKEFPSITEDIEKGCRDGRVYSMVATPVAVDNIMHHVAEATDRGGDVTVFVYIDADLGYLLVQS